MPNGRAESNRFGQLTASQLKESLSRKQQATYRYVPGGRASFRDMGEPQTAAPIFASRRADAWGAWIHRSTGLRSAISPRGARAWTSPSGTEAIGTPAHKAIGAAPLADDGKKNLVMMLFSGGSCQNSHRLRKNIFLFEPTFQWLYRNSFWRPEAFVVCVTYSSSSCRIRSFHVATDALRTARARRAPRVIGVARVLGQAVFPGA